LIEIKETSFTRARPRVSPCCCIVITYPPMAIRRLIQAPMMSV
jgi:hypothetical protein